LWTHGCPVLCRRPIERNLSSSSCTSKPRPIPWTPTSRSHSSQTQRRHPPMRRAQASSCSEKLGSIAMCLFQKKKGA
jgi:hypothetical protein